MRLLFVLGYLVTFFYSIYGEKQCYACVGHGTELQCLTDPDAVNPGKIPCPKRYCTIKRMEYAQEPGKVYSFSRGCEDSPIYLNEFVPSDTYNVYYRACTSNLCNYGNGITEYTGGGSPGFGSGGENIIVLGIPASSGIMNYSPSLIMAILLFVFVTNRFFR